MKMTSNNRETTGKIKILNRMLLPAIAALLIVLTTPAHSVLPKEVQADLLANEITEAITQKNYARAEKLFNDYEELGLEIPPPLKAPRALAYYQLGKFDLALQELEQYLTAVERGSQGYERALAMYSDINKKEEKRKEKERIKEEKKLKKFLSAYGVTDINATNSQGKTALEQAIESGDKQAISILADAGVRVDLEAMLQSAAESNDVNKMRQLVRVGANINAKDDNGWTTLHTAAVMNSTAIAKYLLDAGMKVDVPLKNDGEPFTGELKKKLRTITGKSYDHRTRVGDRSLDLAAGENAVGVAALLIEQGADINAKDRSGWTPLHSAAWENAVGVATLLIEQGADINAKTKYGWTPLNSAAWENAVGVATLLIEQGADINAKDKHGRTPLQIAKDHNNTEIAALLRKAGAKTNTRSTTRTSQKSSQQGDK